MGAGAVVGGAVVGGTVVGGAVGAVVAGWVGAGEVGAGEVGRGVVGAGAVGAGVVGSGECVLSSRGASVSSVVSVSVSSGTVGKDNFHAIGQLFCQVEVAQLIVSKLQTGCGQGIRNRSANQNHGIVLGNRGILSGNADGYSAASEDTDG